MKRILPVKSDLPEPGYPSMGDEALSRRGFFTAALAAGGGLIGATRARAGSASGYHRVTVSVRHHLSGCAEIVEKLIVQSRDARLAAFLKEARERSALVAALRKVLSSHSCDDIADQKKLSRMEARLARTVASHYLSRTKRRTALPIVTAVVGRRRNPELDGLLEAPRSPYRP